MLVEGRAVPFYNPPPSQLDCAAGSISSRPVLELKCTRGRRQQTSEVIILYLHIPKTKVTGVSWRRYSGSHWVKAGNSLDE